ncbi:hypothetical protein [Phyllobacterium lublinensis]|uniref:hypothetical protein n=1 Tax=Phyllobacterium lublinensis TaxID=2875708 RepID=UPI001CC9E126|nr:hypothetical protein [Phyllobacterium sp. 2063]MBZ9654009.1 hypothetical protein [Phyllobacterium sp. 2063]
MNSKTATSAYPVTRARLIADLKEIATEAKKHGDLAAADEALELAWRIAEAEFENHTLQ